MRHWRQSARCAARIALILTGVSPLFPAALQAAIGVPPPSGLVVVIENKPQNNEASYLRSLNNPSISGAALQIHWADIEPVQGKPDWTKLDELFAAAESSKKWVQLLIFPGFFSPQWALEGAQTDTFPLQYGPGKGTEASLPMPWDKVYLGRWLAFVKRLSARYGDSPAFRVMAVDGPTSVSAESTLPSTPPDVRTWQKDSYTPGKYLAAWHEVFGAFAADFPNQYLSLSLGFGLNINERGKLDARERAGVKQAMIDEAMAILGRRFVLQYSNLDGNPGPDRGPQGTELVMSYYGRVITGFQLRTSCEINSGNMGAEGDGPLALRRSIDKGMRPNDAGKHVNYIEIYQPDILADEMQPVLKYGAGLFGQ